MAKVKERIRKIMTKVKMVMREKKKKK